MVKIAICDSDDSKAFQLEEYLLLVENVHRIPLQIEVYLHGSELENAVNSGMEFELVYLAIVMDETSGIDVARRIRKMECEALLVYVSAYEEYWKEILATKTVGFIEKPIKYERVEQSFLNAYHMLLSKEQFYCFHERKNIHRVCVKDIVYMESNKRLVIVHTKKGTYSYYGKLSEAELSLQGMRHHFLRIHKSYLVNAYFVEIIEPNILHLFDGTTLPISEEHRHSIRDYYN